MADISVIKLPSGSEYNIKDAWARQAIEGLGNPTHFLGKSTTAITDGGTQTPTIGGAEVTPHAGDIVVYNNGEFIYGGTSWVELGDLSGLGDLAYKDSASGSVKPTGTVSKPTFTGSFTGTAASVTPTIATTTSAMSSTASVTVDSENITPAFTSSEKTVSVTFGNNA